MKDNAFPFLRSTVHAGPSILIYVSVDYDRSSLHRTQ